MSFDHIQLKFDTQSTQLFISEPTIALCGSNSLHEHSGIPRRGLGGLEPLPLAYDLRNKHAKKCQNMVFSTKI